MRELFGQCLSLSEFGHLKCLDRFGVGQIPVPGNATVVRCTEETFVERILFPLQSMCLERLLEFTEFYSVEEIEILYERQKPDGRKVTDTISIEAVILTQQKGLCYLKGLQGLFQVNFCCDL